MARDLTQGSITSLILKLALPGVISLLGITVNHFIDGIWVGRLGPKALAAIAPSSFIIWIIFSIVNIMPVGMLALISRYYGEKRLDKASDVSGKMLSFISFASIIVLIFGILVTEPMLKMVGVTDEVVRLGSIYLKVVLFMLPAMFLTRGLSSIFRAVGDTATPMRLALVAIAVNLVLDPLLIFGIGPFPRMEMAGAALATVIGYWVSLLWAIIELKRDKLPFKIMPERILDFELKLIWRVARIGLPISISGIVFSIVYLFLSRIAAPFGDFVVASFRVGQLAESVSFMICFGFSQATASMVGQNLGAKFKNRANSASWSAVSMISVITLFLTIVFYTLARSIASVFSSDLATVSAATNYLQIIALSQVFMGVEVVLEGAFAGAGDTYPPMIVSLFGTVLRIPLALILINYTDFGYSSLYWAITISTVLKGITLAFWFRLGKWQTKTV